MSEEILNKPGTLKLSSQGVSYQGSEHPKILVLTENDDWIMSCLNYWQIPDKEFGYVLLHSKINQSIINFLDSTIQLLNPELIITFGANLGKFVKPDLVIKTDKGKFFNPEPRYKKYKLCTLISHSWFKNQKWNSDPWKQHKDLKNYLFKAMKYGM